MQEYCDERGIKVIERFQDAQSGRTMKRNAMGAMLALTKKPNLKIDYVIVHSFSRFSRNLLDFELTKFELEHRGIKLISITQPIEDSSDGDFMRRMLSLFDEHTSREIAKHVKRSMEENARQGFWNGGIPPFGFRACNAGLRGKTIKKKLEIDPIEAEDVRLVYRLYLEGDGSSGPMGIKAITSMLNAKNHIRRGAKWTIGEVHRILTDRTYIGEREFGKKQKRKEQIVVSVPEIIE